MTGPVAGIDPHQDQFTLAVVDANGVHLEHATFPNHGPGYAGAIDFLTAHEVVAVGVEGSASWGAHVAVALVAAGFDAREVPAQRSAAQRRARRLAKTDLVDAEACARALLAEPTLGPVQTLDVYDPLLAELQAVLEHRRMLVDLRVLRLHHVQSQLAKLPTPIRDQLPTTGKIESRLRALEHIDTTVATTRAGAYQLSWLLLVIAADRADRAEIRRLERHIDALLDEHGTTLREEPGIGPIAAATLLVEVGDPHRFATEAKFARWCGTAAVALSSGEGDGVPKRHRLDFRGNRRVNSVLHIVSVTQARSHQPAKDYLERKRADGKTRREARRAHKRHLANRVIRRMWNDENRRLARPLQLAA
jgi:transposase